MLIFRQLFDQRSSTYTYLLADPDSRDAVLIDSVFEQARRDAALIAELSLTLRFTLEKGRRIPAPQFEIPGRLTPRVGDGGFYGTTGVGPDLFRDAQDAVRAMVDHLVQRYGLSPEDAYVLSSLCVDLKISEVVDAGVFIVSALLPLAVFAG